MPGTCARNRRSASAPPSGRASSSRTSGGVGRGGGRAVAHDVVDHAQRVPAEPAALERRGDAPFQALVAGGSAAQPATARRRAPRWSVQTTSAALCGHAELRSTSGHADDCASRAAPPSSRRFVPRGKQLAREALEPNPFYEPWMLLPALRAYAAGQDLRVALVWRGERLVGLFPFQRLARYKGLPAAALAAWRHPHCLLCTPLVRARQRALRGGRAARRHRRLACSSGATCRQDEPFHRTLNEALAARGRRPLVRRSYEPPAAAQGRGDRLGPIAPPDREERARLAQAGRAGSTSTLGPQDDIGRWIDEFLLLEARGWKGRQGSAMACAEANRTYFTRTVTAAFHRGRLRLCGLDLDGRPIGAALQLPRR